MNNFEIEKRNQYDLKENATQSICPICSHTRETHKQKINCTSLDWNRGLGTCHRCGEIFQLHTYKKKQNSKSYKRPESTNNTKLSDNAVKWFEDRKISQFTLRQMKITEGLEFMPQHKKKSNTIQFNYFQNDELINIKYRTGDKKFKLFKGAELIFYNLNGIFNQNEAIISEGEMDALSYIECGLNHSVSVPNGAGKNLDYLDNCIAYFEGKNKIYIATDSDEPGRKLEKELIRRLGIERCYKVDFNDCKDANEYLIKYGKDKLKKTIVDAELYPIEDIVLMKDDGQQLDDFFKYGMKRGFTIGRETFDEKFSIDEGRFVVVTGIPSHGKSEWVDEMTVGYNMKYGWKACICSPENQPVFLHKQKIVPKILGYRPMPEQVHTDWYKKTKEHIDDNFFFVSFKSGSYDLKRCLDKAKELIFRKGIKVLILDPFNKIRLNSSLNKNLNEYTNDYLALIDDFARENNITIFLIAHPTKMLKDPGGGNNIPDFYDVKGGGEFYDMSPFGLSVFRDFEESKTIVKILKVKFSHLGEAQQEIHLDYNINNGRYSAGGYDNTNYLKDYDSENELEMDLVFETDPELLPDESGSLPF